VVDDVDILLPHAAAQRDVGNGIANQAGDIDLGSGIDGHAYRVSSVGDVLADLARLNATDAERIGIVRQVREVIAGRVAIDVGHERPVRIRRARPLDFKSLLATGWCPAQRDVAIEIDVTTLRIDKVTGDRLRCGRGRTFRQRAGDRDVGRGVGVTDQAMRVSPTAGDAQVDVFTCAGAIAGTRDYVAIRIEQLIIDVFLAARRTLEPFNIHIE